MHRPTPLLLCTLVSLLGQGCVIYDEDADVRIHWEFLGRLSCAEAGVTDILLEVDGGDELQEFGFVPCEAGFVDIPGDFPSADHLKPGEYLITVFGFPPEGGATWIAEGLVDLHGGFNELTFRLDPF